MACAAEARERRLTRGAALALLVALALPAALPQAQAQAAQRARVCNVVRTPVLNSPDGFVVGYLMLNKQPPIFRMFIAMLLIGLGYLTATGAIEDIGAKFARHSQTPASVPAAAPGATPKAEPAAAPAAKTEAAPAPDAAKPADPYPGAPKPAQ